MLARTHDLVALVGGVPTTSLAFCPVTLGTR